tara:strand:- start:190 stop:501 length:312 start_codon:yes stop_codon:yes gene_type:complete
MARAFINKASKAVKNLFSKKKARRAVKEVANIGRSPSKLALIGLGSYGGISALEDTGLVKKKRGTLGKKILEKMKKNREFNKKFQYGGGHIVPGKFLRQGGIS